MVMDRNKPVFRRSLPRPRPTYAAVPFAMLLWEEAGGADWLLRLS